MRTVNKILSIIILVLVISCNEKNSTKNNFEVDYNKDSLLYRLDISDSKDSQYLQNKDGDWKESILLKKELFVKDSSFGGLQNISKAIKYAKKIKVSSPYDCYVLNSINVETEKKIFKPVWIWKQNIYWGDGSFGEWGGRIEIDEAVFNYKSELKNGIKIIYKSNVTNGFKLNILNFVSNGNYWELVSRESLNTIRNNATDEEVGYCIDTINSNCEKRFNKSNQIFINNEMMFDLNDRKCYFKK